MIRDVIVVEKIQKKNKSQFIYLFFLKIKHYSNIVCIYISCATRTHLLLCFFILSSFVFLRESKYKNILVAVFATWGELLPHKLMYLNFSNMCFVLMEKEKNLIIINTFYNTMKKKTFNVFNFFYFHFKNYNTFCLVWRLLLKIIKLKNI